MGDDWIPTIYAEKIRPGRTRSYQMAVPKKENSAEIQYTLLGIELKVGKLRLSCPDLATARYLRIFARVGCDTFAVPYDITQIGRLADELEMSWHRGLLLLKSETRDRSLRAVSQYRAALIRDIRNGIIAAGPGEQMPAFPLSSKRRIAG